MPTRSYASFDLSVARVDDGYFVRVLSSPAGETPPTPFVPPFTEDRLHLMLLQLRNPTFRGINRRRVDAATAAAEELGAGLFSALFRDSVGDVFVTSKAQAPNGLRLRLDLTEAPELSELPWELLFDPTVRRFVALSERTPVVRFLRMAGPTPFHIDGPLHILTVLSSPVGLEELNIDAEWRALREELEPEIRAGRITVGRLKMPTLAELHRHLRAGTVHVLHFTGHGEFDAATQDGVLYFTDRYGRPAKVWPSQLGPYLYDHDPLRLVVLNACQTGTPDGEDAFGGMAQGLIQQGVPAVVAMQAPVSDAAAICFARDFYGAIALGQPVDQAVTGARKAVGAEHQFEWASPVLYLRSSDGLLFETTENASRQPKITDPTTDADAAGPDRPQDPPPSVKSQAAQLGSRSKQSVPPSATPDAPAAAAVLPALRLADSPGFRNSKTGTVDARPDKLLRLPAGDRGTIVRWLVRGGRPVHTDEAVLVLDVSDGPGRSAEKTYRSPAAGTLIRAKRPGTPVNSRTTVARLI